MSEEKPGTFIGGGTPKTYAEAAYSDSHADMVISTNNLNRLRDYHGLTSEEAGELKNQHAGFLDELTADSNVAQNLHDLMTWRITDPPTKDEVRGWQVDACRQVRERFREDADGLMDKARDYVKARPALAEMLNATGLGSHPDVVLAIVEKVRRAG